MAYKITVDPAARLDIIEAIDWYNDKQRGLGIRFYKHIKTALKNIQRILLDMPSGIKPSIRPIYINSHK